MTVKRKNILGLIGLLFTLTTHAITYDMVPIGNPGNANDITGFGAVAYPYQMGKYEVTIEQYTAFLNAVATTDTHGLYNSNMANIANVAGISQSGTQGRASSSIAAAVLSDPLPACRGLAQHGLLTGCQIINRQACKIHRQRKKAPTS